MPPTATMATTTTTSKRSSTPQNGDFDQLSSLGSESIMDDPSSVRSGYASYQAHQRSLRQNNNNNNNNDNTANNHRSSVTSNSFSSGSTMSLRSNSVGGGNTYISGLTEEFSVTMGIASGAHRSSSMSSSAIDLTGVSGLYEKSAEVSAMHEHLEPNNDDDEEDDDEGLSHHTPSERDVNNNESGFLSSKGGSGGSKIMSAIAPRSSEHFSARSSQRRLKQQQKRGSQQALLQQTESFTMNRLRVQDIALYGRGEATKCWNELLLSSAATTTTTTMTEEAKEAEPITTILEDPDETQTKEEQEGQAVDDDKDETNKSFETALSATSAFALPAKKRHLVLLSGPSGSGKSRLVQEWTKQPKKKKKNKQQPRLLCLGGKFDQSHNNLPYSGIALACEKFLATLFAIQAVSNIPKAEDDGVAVRGVEEAGSSSSGSSGITTTTSEKEARHMRMSSMMPPSENNTSKTSAKEFTSSRSSSSSSLSSDNEHGHPNWNVSYEEVCTRLNETLDTEETKLLVEFIPTLKSMLSSMNGNKNDATTTIDVAEDGAGVASPDESNNPTSTTDQASGDTNLFSKKSLQFQHAFKKFLRTLSEMAATTTTTTTASTKPSSLVLTLDDIQWADTPSLELIKAIVTDQENKFGLIVVGCFRSEEVNEEWIQDLQDTTHYGADSVTTLEIDNLSVNYVHAMIRDMMMIMAEDEDLSAKALQLAELVHQKTLGNPLFVIQYMKLLVDVELLHFNVGMFEWNWDIQCIDEMTMATENVVDVMIQKMKKKLPNATMRVLPLIGSLGFSFTKQIFAKVVTHFNQRLIDGVGVGEDDGEGETMKETEATLLPNEIATTCIKEGLIEGFGTEWYRWRHDKLQEAAMSLVDPETLSGLQYQLGELLLDTLSPLELEEVLFVVTNLLNKKRGNSVGTEETSSDDEKKRRLQISRLNFRAGMKAIESASFVPASWYLSRGIDLLPSDRWQNHYELTLELYSTAAQAAYSTGDFKKLSKLCDEVLAQKDRPLLDKQRVYNALLDSIGAQDRMGDAAKMCMEVLAKLGCKFPKRAQALYTIAGLVRTEMTLKNRTAEEISKYQTMTDPSKIWAMKLLDKLFTFLYQDKSDMVPLAILKSLRWTIKYGVCDLAMPNFASVGFMLAAFLGDLKGGRIYGQRALEMLARSGSEDIKSRTLLVAYGSLLHWTTPFGDCRAPILKGYHVGLKMGDVESALWCILFYLWFSLFLGTPLESIAEDLQVYSKQMRKFKQKKHESWTLITLQAILNLIGCRENTKKSRLIGEAISEDKLMEKTDEIHILKPALNLFQMYTMFYFGEHEAVVSMIESNEDGYFEKAVPGIAALVVNVFHSALSCISMARLTGKSKYKKMAKKFTKKIKMWVDKGNPNVIQYKALLESEWAAMANKKHEAIHNFEVAILMAGRRGLLQDRALAHERCSDFYVSIGDDKEAAYHAKKAVAMYEEWGGLAVAKRLKETRPELFERPSEVLVKER